MQRLVLIVSLILSFCGCSHTNPANQPVSTPPIEVHFSPDGGIQKRIIKAIDQSKSSIDIAIYSFTNDKIAQSLKEAKDRGVKIRIIMDSRQTKSNHSQHTFLKDNGFEVKLKKGTARGLMHHKFIIFDGQLLMTGSYNITKNAERYNYENVLFISNRPVVEKYQILFNQLWQD